MEAEKFPAWFARQLAHREWTAADFARHSGFSPGMVSNWIRGRRTPSPESVDKIADVLGADVATVMVLAGHLPEVEPIDPDDPVERVCAKLRRARLTLEQFDAVEGMVDRYREWNRKMAREAKGR